MPQKCPPVLLSWIRLLYLNDEGALRSFRNTLERLAVDAYLQIAAILDGIACEYNGQLIQAQSR